MEKFLNDIKPFFYRKQITYVDVGAYVGDTYQAVRNAGLSLGEACLIEPNPASFARLKERVAGLDGTRKTTLHNIALGASKGRARLTAAETMTRVISVVSSRSSGKDDENGTFEVPIKTLDKIAENLLSGRISLLKVDVEGFEEQVLGGARELLGKEAIDVIYIEAGLDPENRQQCYYRTIEDVLAPYGYRIFRLYEQKNEWMDDNPVLRRVNIAFMSRRFAAENPSRLSKELYQARQQVERQDGELRDLSAELEEARNALSETTGRYETLTGERDALGEAMRRNDAETGERIAELEQRLEQATGERDALGEAMRRNDAEAGERIAELEQRLERATGERDALGEAMRRSDAETGERIAELEQRLERATGERDTLREAMQRNDAETGERIAEMERRLERATGERDALREAMRRNDAEAGERIAELEQRLERATDERDALGEAMRRNDAETGERFAALEGSLEQARARHAADGRQLEVLRKDRTALLRYGEELEKRYRAVLGSTSWRVLGPARVAVRNVRSLFTGKAGRPNRVPKLPKLSAPLKEDHPKPTRSERKGATAKAASKPPNRKLKEAAGDLLRQTYERMPSRIQASVPDAARRIVKKSAMAGDPSELVKKIDDKMWGGFSRSALADLAAIKADTSRPARIRADACHSLARWHAVQGDFAAALKEMEDRRAIDTRIVRFKRQYMLESLFLCRVGRGEEARALVEQQSAAGAFDTSVQLMLANTWNPAVTGTRTTEAEEKVLEHINAVYRHFGLVEIEKRNADAPLSIDNLRGREVKRHVDPDVKVTVIVPTFNAQDTILTALRSLAEQSWQNLEVLVVDDCSTDDTAAVAEAFAMDDPRFRVIRQKVNGGSYACRNRALEDATGTYITIHDSDDFAHPDRIFCHVNDLKTSKFRYNLSKWVRTLPSLFFVGVWRPQEDLHNLNMGSFFVHREIFDLVGKWDKVRVSGDREFISRVETLCGGRNRRMIADGCPLVFGRVSETSLTQTKETSVATVYNGIRREYHEASDYVHKKLAARMSDNPRATAAPEIKAPGIITTGRITRHPDILFIGDWHMQGGSFHSASNMMKAAIADGMKVGVLNYPRYDYDVARHLRYEIRDFFYDNGISIYAPGERIVSKTVILTYPALLHHELDRFPQIEHERLVVVVNQMAERNRSGTDVAYDPERVRRHLVEFFGHEGDWVPISNGVRKIMEGDPRYPVPHRDTWTPMVDLDEWIVGTPRWRGGERKRPVIGRHGRDHVLKWPGSRDALLEAYCAEKPCEVRFLGGAGQAKKLVGDMPSNWHVESFGARDVKEFLADLGFFLHYPHEDYIEEFGRAPMEAMAIGVPVILPPVFRDTFADAALYAEPEDVWRTVETLWRDEAAYLERAAAGRDFVRSNCGLDRFRHRLRIADGVASVDDDARAVPVS